MENHRYIFAPRMQRVGKFKRRSHLYIWLNRPRPALTEIASFLGAVIYIGLVLLQVLFVILSLVAEILM